MIFIELLLIKVIIVIKKFEATFLYNNTRFKICKICFKKICFLVIDIKKDKNTKTHTFYIY